MLVLCVRQDMVCNDSCVEFFVSPAAETTADSEYLNFGIAVGDLLSFY